ncbi:sporulation integral membrane protein YtvI [Oceanobacillus caeni]|uniref:sporulation integral membrane protein YtvI n=1 Tax=Oceanobacillus caeni TaxID=405946 RepID=UPI002149FD25|nr:sporulation integral membrane protein YtvI [Oceanobacillus caeni]MCR1835750.1 sporulation integral membrane protein YtvI [Oceanobacillus caeni]
MAKFFTTKRIVIAVSLLLIAIILYFYSSAFMPLILATVTAFILEPLVRFLQKHLKLKTRAPAVLISFLLFVLSIAFIFYVAITRVVNETIRFAERLPYYIIDINVFIEKLLEDINKTAAGLPPIFINEMEGQISNLLEWLTNMAQGMIPILAGWIQGIPNLVVVIIIYLIALFLISMDLPKYRKIFYSKFREENAEKIQYILQRSTRFFTGFMKAQFFVSIIIFIVTYIGLIFISPHNALVMSLVIWIIDLIPIIGSIVILAPWALFDLIAGDTSTGIQLLVLAAILLIIRRTVEPKVMGDQIGLPPLPTLIGLWLGLYFFGVIGLIIGPLSIIAILSAKEAGLIKLDFKI